MKMINKILKVGVIQTSLDANAAWQSQKESGASWKKDLKMLNHKNKS